jgi:hypothetical protein
MQRTALGADVGVGVGLADGEKVDVDAVEVLVVSGNSVLSAVTMVVETKTPTVEVTVVCADKGAAVGDSEGVDVGRAEVVGDADAEGATVGGAEGAVVGVTVGDAIGTAVGLVVGNTVGVAVGASEGNAVVGATVGVSVGDVVVGAAVGATVGELEYNASRSQHGPTILHPAEASLGMSTLPGHASRSSSPASLRGPWPHCTVL